MQIWRLLNVLVLNGESCDWKDPLKLSKLPDTPSGPQKIVWENITRSCSYFCEYPDKDHVDFDFEGLMASKSLDYSGEEISHALPLKLEEILPGLPAPLVAGSLDATMVARDDVKAWLCNPWLAMKPREVWPSVPKSAKINCNRAEWVSICSELYKRNIIVPIDEQDIFSVGGVRVLNGAFAVLKRGDPAPGQSRVTRLIMNFIPSNEFQVLKGGDMGTLAGSTSWCGLQLPPSHVLLWSGDDQKGAYYAWKLPEVWRPFMTFKWPVPGYIVDRPELSECFVAASVIPMGWINAVPLFQHLHRQLGMSDAEFSANHPPEAEWRRDRPMPRVEPKLQPFWVQYYLDDYDCPELIPVESWEEVKGTFSTIHLNQRQAYDRVGVAISENKAHVRDPVVVRMGAEVDGIKGLISSPRTKVLETIWFCIWTMGHACPTNKNLMMLLGRFVRVFEFRRPLMSFLGNSWPKGSIHVRFPLGISTLQCLLRSCVGATLALTDLRTPVDGLVSCSDASETGGGLCVSGQLTDEGQAALEILEGPLGDSAPRFQSAGAMPMPTLSKTGPRIFVVSLFDGVSAIMCTLSRLDCSIVGFASSEIDKDCRKLTRKRWPGIIELGDVEQIGEEVISNLSRSVGYKIDLVLLTAGSPCQDLSSLLAGGLGLEGSRSRLFFEIPRIKKLLTKHFLCPVHSFVENVFSMTADNRNEFSKALGCQPVLIDASWFSWCRRPRLFWPSWTIKPSEGENLIDRGDFLEWQFPVVRAEAQHWVDPGCVWHGHQPLPTLTRSLPRKKPPKNPASIATASQQAVDRWTSDSFRFQVYHYEEHHLVEAHGQLRTPSISERERLMGFDEGYISKALSPKWSLQKQFDVGSCMIGNTFNVHVVVMLAHSLLDIFNGAPLVRDHRALIGCVGQAPAGWTCYPNFVQNSKPDASATALVKHLLRRGEKGGSDVRLDVGIPFRIKAFPRAGLRTSLFTWKIIHGYRWKNPAHINCLELQALSNSIQWRLRKCSRLRHRVLHLVDSQVCAAVVAKGRTSSFRLRRALKKLNCLLLAGGLLLSVGYVHTTDNPADIPSRWADKPQPPPKPDNNNVEDAPCNKL